MEIVSVPDPVLNLKAKSIINFDKKLKKLIDEMVKTLKSARDPEGVGLAAPQVNISKRLFIIQTNPEAPHSKAKYREFINPQIVHTKLKKSLKSSKANPQQASSILEGCLSINNVWGYPDRDESITIEYQNYKGKKITQTFSGFPARLVQHEMDHLNGILFTHIVLRQNKDLYSIEKDDDTNEPTLAPLEI